ncbi:hypothetical protein BS47DRAFT_1301789 [Hydnum rufescens UP504]|uniref:Uncharacterized protein n=1 Tax=Hydnum rufescens UP504 TaxID=1448309 RepID=A0A9P6APA2_9AGAM|nr:hypothetical protein BS47DRAFT_1301789 [Hydnum rufescens UP504]
MQSKYVSWEPLALQYESVQASPSKIQILKDRQSCHACHKHAQAYRWNNDVLPSLLCPFMKAMQEHFSKSASSTPGNPAMCTCGKKLHSLKVLCVSMEQLENIVLEVCLCHTAGIQWLFPCAPLCPSLAVSHNMLEPIASLFLNMAPNQRAWAPWWWNISGLVGMNLPWETHFGDTLKMHLHTIKCLFPW